MKITYHRVGRGFVALNAQHEIVGILKSFEDSWKPDLKTALKTNPREPTTKGGD